MMLTPAAGTSDAATSAAVAVPRYVFVSFASEDIELARHAVRRLETAGLRCWISERDIEAAASYPAAITNALVGSGALLLLLTEAANASPHVLREIELAFNARTPILPVRMSGVLPSSDLQYFLSTTQWLDAGADLDESDLQKIESRLRGLLQSSRRDDDGGTARQYPWWAMVAALGLLVIIAVASWTWNGRREVVAENTTVPAPPSSSEPQQVGIPGASVKVNPRDGQAYVWVPPGRFVMGCSANDPACDNDEKPARSVELKTGFFLARTEVTQGQYAHLLSAPTSAADDRPVTRVSWASAKAYCAAAGGRLPSEAEWEYAARGGTATRYYGTLSAIAWFADNTDGEAHPVATKAPNAFGLHDMLGNVSEWVRDRYYNAYDDTADPTTVVEEPLAGNASGVARGGSWLSDGEGVRVSRRLEMSPDAEEPHIGFRCAVDQL